MVGLGNPGKEYDDTRHNVGFRVVEELSTKFEARNSKQFPRQRQVQLGGQANTKFKFSKRFIAEVCDLGEIKIVKPQTFMNRSGVAVRRIIDYYQNSKFETRNSKLEWLWVVHDDLDIEWGEYKIDFAKGPKVHNGVNSVEEQLGTDQFWRVRVGVDGRSREERGRVPGDRYVLMKLMSEEIDELDRVVGEIALGLLDQLAE